MTPAAYLQPYGHAIPTPNLQRLAERGVLFRRALLCRTDLLAQPRRPLDRAVSAQRRHVGLG